MPILVAATARAEAPNREPQVDLALVHAPGRDHPWGVRAGATFLVSVGDHCTWSEEDCRTGSVWPVLGPTLHTAWRGGDRLAFDLGLTGGVGVVDMHQTGFLPEWIVTGLLAARFEVGELPGMAVGVAAGRSLSYDERVSPNGVRTWGMDILALTLDGSAVVGAAGLERPVLGAGFTLSTMAADLM